MSAEPGGAPSEMAAASARSPLVAVALLSAVALAYEILLLRLFSIVQFHHTAYMVISLALLGYGASGTALALWRRRWIERFESVFVASSALFGVSAVGCFALAQRVTVNPEELLWSPRQLAWLLALYLLLAVPFFFVGAAVGSALIRYPASRIYAADLIGAGAGTLVVVGLLWVLSPGGVLRSLAASALVAALLGAARLGWLSARRGGLLLVVGLAIWAIPESWVEPRPSPYKGLSQALRVEGAELVEERSSPLALVSVVESSEIPLRHAPGLSLAVPREPVEQIGLFLDAETLLPILHWEESSGRLAYLEFSTQALPYAVSDPRRVLVLGAGGGEEVARARYHGAGSIVGVEIDPQVVDLVADEYAEYSGHLYDRDGVEIAIDDVRGFAASAGASGDDFDLVVLAASGGYGGGGPALAALAENYLLTVEAIGGYLDLVAPGGLLSATVFVGNPPRSTLKLVATAIVALERRGVTDPAASLAIVRSWQTATLVVKRGAFGAEEISRLRRFSAERLFDPVFFPGMEESEANRYNRLAEPLFHQGVVALLGAGRESFLERYKFDVRPATDDRPFFHQFFRWGTLEEIAAARGSGGLSLLEAGYLVLVATLVLALLSALVLVLAPLVAFGERGGGSIRTRVVVYFGALGLGFLLVEVAFLQQLILVLHHPVYSAAVVLASFLAFAGLGSALAPRLERRWRGGTLLGVGAGIVVLGVVDLALMAAFSASVAAASTVARVVFSLLVVAPLALLMGMPFPIGLARLKSSAGELVPWAWAINGCASVVSPIVATLVAVHWGFRVVVVLALVTYGVAVAARIRPGGSAASTASP